MQVVGCGHVYCMQCLNTATRGQEEKICPFCREGFEFAIKDMSMKRMVMALKIKCKNEGCQWIGDLSNLQPHLEDCDYLLINCTSYRCDVNVERRNLITHLIEECLFLRFKCLLCRIFTCSSTEELSEHKMVCTMRPLKCSYSHLGCTFEGTKDCMDEHIKADVSIHLALSTEEIGRLKQHNIEINKEKNKKLEAKFAGLQEKYVYLKETFTEKLDQNVRLLNQKLSGLQSKLDKTINEKDKTIQTYQKKIDDLNENFQERVSHEKMIHNNSSNYTDDFIWVLDNFNEKFQKAKGDNIAITSSNFVWKRYIFKLRAYLNGRTDSRNTHFSLFFILVKGEHDAILQWPFTYDVRLMAVSQDNETKTDETITVNYTVPGTLHCFRQPIKNVNDGCGVDEFLPHTEMLKSFVKDDVMFIKCQIK